MQQFSKKLHFLQNTTKKFKRKITYIQEYQRDFLKEAYNIRVEYESFATSIEINFI